VTHTNTVSGIGTYCFFCNTAGHVAKKVKLNAALGMYGPVGKSMVCFVRRKAKTAACMVPLHYFPQYHATPARLCVSPSTVVLYGRYTVVFVRHDCVAVCVLALTPLGLTLCTELRHPLLLPAVRFDAGSPQIRHRLQGFAERRCVCVWGAAGDEVSYLGCRTHSFMGVSGVIVPPETTEMQLMKLSFASLPDFDAISWAQRVWRFQL
jgi:hypothetical protein